MTKKKRIAIIVIVTCAFVYFFLSYAEDYCVRKENVFTCISHSLFYKIERSKDGDVSKEFRLYLEDGDIFTDGSICLGDNKDEIIWILTRLNNFDTESVNEKLRSQYMDKYDRGYSYYYTEINDDNFEIWKFTHNNQFEWDKYWQDEYDERDFVGKMLIAEIGSTIDALENYNYPNINKILFMKKFGNGFLKFLRLVVACIGVFSVFYIFQVDN